MNQLHSLTNAQSQAIKQFNALRIRALWDSWLAKLLMKYNGPRSFVGSDNSGLHGQRLSGSHRICVESIIGTVRPTDDFDKDFRPLKQHLRDRWVSTLNRLRTGGWQPITVHKIGESYYVAKGHLRVSVARSLDMKQIEAEVWDHSSCRTPLAECGSNQRELRRHTESFSMN